MFVVSFRAQHARRKLCVASLVLFPLLGCTAPAPAPLQDRDVAGALSARDPRLASDVADLSGLAPLALPRPTPDELADPHSAGFWRGCAFAWNPAVRAARRELGSVLASADAAGLPGNIEIEAENEGFDRPQDETKLTLSFDLLGLAGLGPSRAARASARAQVHRARSQFESALWTASFDVERARLRLAASDARIERLQELFVRAQAQEARVEILERRGRLSDVEALMARTTQHDVEHALSQEHGQVAVLRGELAVSSGLPSGNPALLIPAAELLSLAHSPPAPVSAIELLENLPRLRELRSEYALAEARVREIASEAWPSLRAGPSLRFLPSEVLLGGLLDVSLPWPGSVQPRVLAAVQEREAARERLEDELLAALVRAEQLRLELAEARQRADTHAAEVDATALAMLDTQTRLLALGRADYSEWNRRLRESQQAALDLVDQRAQVRLLELDLQEACGVRANAAEVTP